MNYRVVRAKDKLWVHFRGRIYSLPINIKKGITASTDESTDELVAPFSCKVLKVLVTSGQKIFKGDPVVTVEAMKMEYSYTSPRDGVIEKVLIAPGVIVQEGTHFVVWRKP